MHLIRHAATTPLTPVQEGATTSAPSVQNFKDNAPTWEELQQLLEDREATLGCAPEDPETVRAHPQ